MRRCSCGSKSRSGRTPPAAEARNTPLARRELSYLPGVRPHKVRLHGAAPAPCPRPTPSPFIPRGNATENRRRGGTRCWDRATSRRNTRARHWHRWPWKTRYNRRSRRCPARPYPDSDSPGRGDVFKNGHTKNRAGRTLLKIFTYLCPVISKPETEDDREYLRTLFATTTISSPCAPSLDGGTHRGGFLFCTPLHTAFSACVPWVHALCRRGCFSSFTGK